MHRLADQGGVRQGWGNVSVFLLFIGSNTDRTFPAHTHTLHTYVHFPVSIRWVKKGWGQQAYVWISFSLSLTLHLSLSDSILFAPHQGAVLHPYICDSPPLTCSHSLWFLCVRLFALHLTYMNQSVNPISFRLKPDGFASDQPSW